jgi:PAS domain S-box-containing protein
MAGFLLLLTALVSMISARILLAGALSLEKEMARESVDMGRQLLRQDTDELDRLAQDLTVPSFTADSLTAETCQRLRVNLAAFFRADGGLAYAKAYDDERKTVIPLPELVWSAVLHSDRLSPSPAKNPASGLLVAGTDVWIMAARSVPSIPGEGVTAGTLILGRRLGPSHEWRPAGYGRGLFAVYPSTEGPAPAETVIKVTPERTIKAVGQIRDIEGRPTITLETTLKQRVFAQGVTSLFFLTGWILLSGAAIGLFAFWVVDRWVLQDLSESLDGLKRGVAAVIAGADLLPRLKTSRKDEMGMVANSLNDMLETLERSHQSLRASEEKYRTLVESAPDAIVQLDTEGRIVAGNRAFFERMPGQSEETATGRTLAEEWPGMLSDAIMAAISRLRESDTTTLSDLSDSQTPERWYSASLARAGRSTHRASYTLVMLRDETERVKAQRMSESRRQDLIQAQKMTAMGTLVAGVAHEVNNPNTVISLNLAALRRRLDILLAGPGAVADSRPLVEDIKALVMETGEASSRIAAMVASLKAFARPASEKMTEDVSVNQFINTACDMLKHTIAKRQCVLKTTLTESLPAVRGNAQQLTQVVMNLVENACEASLKPDSEIEIGSAPGPGGDTVHVTVRDSGSGIAPEHVDRIFEPFFTTRRDQGGTGLGLSISAEIVRAHGGRIEVKSPSGRGSLFTLVLPAALRKDSHDL